MKLPYRFLYVFFWVIPRRLNCICRRFGTLYLYKRRVYTRLLYLPPPQLLTHSEPPTTCCPLPTGPTNSSKPRLRYKYHVLLSLTILHIQPLKMELIECSETSANQNRTPGKYPKEYIQDSKHGESLKSFPIDFLKILKYEISWKSVR